MQRLPAQQMEIDVCVCVCNKTNVNFLTEEVEAFIVFFMGFIGPYLKMI